METTTATTGSIMVYPQAPTREAELRAIPAKWADPPKDMIAKLPKGGDKDKNNWQTCRVCGGWHAKNAVHLDYMGHADVTLALIDSDPLWSWTPMAFTPEGLPLVSVNKGTATMWIKLTVLGKTLPAVGSCPDLKEDRDKELIGDALRNGAMRFGIGVKLWSKTDGEIAAEPPADAAPPPQAPASPSPAPARIPAAQAATSEAAARGRAAADAAMSGDPRSAPALTDPADARTEVTLPTEVLARADKLIAATPTLTVNQRTVQLVQLARKIDSAKVGEWGAMLADDAVWAAACAKWGLEA